MLNKSKTPVTNTPPSFVRTLSVGGALLFGMLGLCALLAIIEARKHEPAPLPMNSRVADFALTNQAGQVTTLADLTNHVWVADIIFTRCASSCPIMTREMKQLSVAIPAGSQCKLVSLTTNPEYDSPAILPQYTTRWMFLTGTKQEVAALAGDNLKLGSVPIPPAERKEAFDFFIHSTLFVIVDKHANLREAFETTGDNLHWEDVQPRILAAIKQLESEP